MSKDVWRTLEYIVDNPQPQLQIAINTNLGTDKKLIDKLINTINRLEDKVDRIDVYTSVESSKDYAEYARDGLDYDYWYDNCKRVLRETNSLVAIMTTLNILCLHGFHNFIEDIMHLRIEFNENLENNRVPISLNYLRWPPHLQSTLLDVHDRKYFVGMFLKQGKRWLKYNSPDKWARLYLEEYDQLKRWCDYLLHEPTQLKFRKDFVNFIKAYDMRRGKDFTKVYPGMAHLLEDWSV